MLKTENIETENLTTKTLLKLSLLKKCKYIATIWEIIYDMYKRKRVGILILSGAFQLIIDNEIPQLKNGPETWKSTLQKKKNEKPIKVWIKPH